MQVISTFSTETEIKDIFVESIQIFRDDEFSQTYEWDGEVVKDWMPGHDIYFSAQFPDVYEEHMRPAINWYCPETHFRGALLGMKKNYEDKKTVITGKIDGQLVRGKLDIKVLLVNKDGFVHSIESRRKIILEGKQSFFPIGVMPFSEELKNAFCRLAMSIDTDPEELFSIANCRAVFNKNSSLYDDENGEPSSFMSTKHFALYEIWRQMIEIALSNENFTELIDPDETEEDIRIGVIWSNILRKIFPGKSLEQIRKMRKQEYWRFCSLIQSEFLKGCSSTLNK